MKTLIQAHRGTPFFCPENSLEGFSLAVKQGADAIELDVHLSKDGEIIVAHDARLERVSDGAGYINDHTAEELKSLALLKPGSDAAAGDAAVCRIPTLKEVFALIKPTALEMNIELKTTERLYPQLPEKLIALADEYGMADRIIYSSFNHYSLLQMKQLRPASRTGLLYELGMVDPWVYANYVHAYAIHPHYFVIAALPETVKRCHENGVKVNVWTVDDPQAIRQMMQCGVDGIITNRADIAARCRDEMVQGGI